MLAGQPRLGVPLTLMTAWPLDQLMPGGARTENVAARLRHGPAHSHRAEIPRQK
jgi:hypothetical protein